MIPKDTSYGNGRLKAIKEIQVWLDKKIEAVKKQPDDGDIHKKCARSGVVSAYKTIQQYLEVKYRNTKLNIDEDYNL